MKHWILRASQVIGLVLLLISLSAALRPNSQPDARKESLALRQLGHDYLIAVGDSTTRIPAITNSKEGALLLTLQRPIDYDTLATLCKAVLARYEIWQNYSLELEDCSSGIVFLGSLWSPNQATTDFFPSGAACMDRDQEARCANVSLTFYPAERKGIPTGHYLLGGVGFLLLVMGSVMGETTIPSAGTSTVVATASVIHPPTTRTSLIQITEHCSLNETDLLLTIGTEEQQLTYRETKLLIYLARHPNEVLARTDIHDAVWGDEGLITGRSLDVFISRLRKKMLAEPAVEIQTVHGIGYRFRVN